MSVIAEKVFEAVKALPEPQAAEVLDFVERLKAKLDAETRARRAGTVGLISGKSWPGLNGINPPRPFTDTPT